MQIKTFEAKTMAEALTNVKNEMGPDAVIISTKNTRKGAGSFGLFGVPNVEVTAAMGYEEKEKKAIKPSIETSDVELLSDQLKDIKELLFEMSRSKQSHFSGNVISDGFKSLHTTMIQAGVSPKLSIKLIEKSRNFIGDRGNNVVSAYLAKEALAKSIMNMVRVSPDFDGNGRSNKGRSIAFIGPTGVGKTTTLAKLAAHYTMKLGKDVALITIDTYRIGAVEQLKIYAEILKVPMAVASTPKDLSDKVKSFSDKDIILIDTAGGNQKDQSRISLLKDFFITNDIDVDLHLLASATTKASDLVDILDKFGELQISRYIISKIDESTRFGSLLNIATKYKVPYSYFTTGQKVPEDIELATPERVADLILGISSDNTFSTGI